MTAAPDVALIAGPHVSHSERGRPASPTLPPELLADAARRLGWAALIYAGGGAVAHFGRRLLLAGIGAGGTALHVSDLLGAGMLVMGTTVYLLSRSGIIPAKRLLDVALVFEVL